MKVLLISFSFPPAGGVGVLRALSLAKYLPEHGVQVDVLTARNAPAVGKDLALLAQVPAEVRVHRTWTLDLPFAMRKWIKRLVLRVGARRHSGRAAAPASTAGEGVLKRLVGRLLLPDPQVGWLPFAGPAARRLVRTHAIDAVIMTVPPFSSMRLAAILRKTFPHLPIVVDFRDEWLSTTLQLVSFNQDPHAAAVARRTEADAVRAASAIVLVTEAARRELIGRYPEQPTDKFHTISNGFESRVDASASLTVRGERIVLTYLGSVYGSTNPSSVVEAVLSLPPSLRARLLLRFIGHVETGVYRQMLEQLGDTVELKGFLPQAEALRAMDDTDYLLLITRDPINVSAKFYDYLSGSKPIVAAVHPQGDVRRLLEETGAGYWADVHSPEAIARLLRTLLEGEGGTLVRNEERIQGYHRRVLAGRYAELLRGLVEA
jgi:glycosyltransferase involved in cell wall biosynthesis